MTEFLLGFINLVLHLDKYLVILVQNYGALTYGILFFIIFMETGFVVTPFLPGDSLLFAAGALASRGALDKWWLFILLSGAAILGDTVNYWIGHFIGPKIFKREKSLFFNKKYLVRTHNFYKKHGGKTIVLARFIPIVRTFAPFVAGIGKMSYIRFLSFNVIGGVLWILIFVFGGFYFGNIPVVQRNFSLIIVVIILFSLMPIFIEIWNNRKGYESPKKIS